MSGIFHFHQIQVVIFISSSRTWVVFPFNTTSTKNTTIYETNYCHLFAANARARSARVKQVESLKFVSVDLKSPGWKPPPPDISSHINPGYKPPVISPLG